MAESQKEKKVPDFTASMADFFHERVDQAIESRKLKASDLARNYLVHLLEHFALSENLFDESVDTGKKRIETLAEMYLKASQAEVSVRAETLRKLGDTSLYISGFFGDSLNRKLVDIDYYAGMGGAAYANLAEINADDAYAPVFYDLSRRFMDFVDVLTMISQYSLVQTDKDLLRLYDRYLSTGSELAKAQLLEKGLLTSSLPAKINKQ